MKVHDFRTTLTAYLSLLGGDPEFSDNLEPYAAVVERALAADTLSADLHYWKSRVLSFPNLKDGRLSEAPKVGEAFHEAKRAVALDPINGAYRENLAFLLVLKGDDKGGADLYRQINADHPMYLLLHDWERMPPIEGTVALDDSTRFLMPINSPLSILAAGAIRTSVFRGTAKALEHNCQKNWPSFRLIPDTSQTRYPKGTARYAQHLRWRGDRLEPDAKLSDVVGGQEPGVGGGGIWVEVLESRALPSDPPGSRPGVKDGELYCRIGFHNKR